MLTVKRQGFAVDTFFAHSGVMLEEDQVSTLIENSDGYKLYFELKRNSGPNKTFDLKASLKLFKGIKLVKDKTLVKSGEYLLDILDIIRPFLNPNEEQSTNIRSEKFLHILNLIANNTTYQEAKFCIAYNGNEEFDLKYSYQ